ncbi:MAG: hypothetical protein AB1416_06050, partial [Actinomycetota bacterium]
MTVRDTQTPPPPPPDGLEGAVRAEGRRLARAYPSPLRHPARALDRRAMDLVSASPAVQAALFRFVDATPACRSTRELTEHLTALLDVVGEPPALLGAPEALAHVPGGARLVGAAAGRAVRHMAHRFI